MNARGLGGAACSDVDAFLMPFADRLKMETALFNEQPPDHLDAKLVIVRGLLKAPADALGRSIEGSRRA